MEKKIFIFIICVLLAALSGGRASADAAFIRDMMEKKEATLADGCRAVYYFSGGDENEASGDYSSVSGGSKNVASGYISSVSGGASNTASGSRSSVSGGDSRTAAGDYDWAAGALWQDN